MPSIRTVFTQGDQICNNGVVRLNDDPLLIAAQTQDEKLVAVRKDETDLDEFMYHLNFEELDSETAASNYDNQIFRENQYHDI